MGKPGQKLLARRDDLKRLITRLGYQPRRADILVFAQHAAEGVTREGSRLGFLPGHNHPGVQSTRQGHGNPLLTTEIPRQILGECLPERPIKAFSVECFLALPVSWMEITEFLLEGTVAKSPSRGRRQQLDALKERAVLEDRATSDKLSHSARIQPP